MYVCCFWSLDVCSFSDAYGNEASGRPKAPSVLGVRVAGWGRGGFSLTWMLEWHIIFCVMFHIHIHITYICYVYIYIFIYIYIIVLHVIWYIHIDNINIYIYIHNWVAVLFGCVRMPFAQSSRQVDCWQLMEPWTVNTGQLFPCKDWEAVNYESYSMSTLD